MIVVIEVADYDDGGDGGGDDDDGGGGGDGPTLGRIVDGKPSVTFRMVFCSDFWQSAHERRRLSNLSTTSILSLSFFPEDIFNKMQLKFCS